MNVNIIDGYRGISHVTAENIGDQNAGTFGPDLLVWDVGEKLRCEQISNNLVKIKDGAFTWQGRRGSIDVGKYDDLDIENGKQGEERIDTVAIRYTKDSITNVEKFDLVVIKGEISTTTGGARPPELVKDPIRNGAILSEVALYNVYIQHLNITSITPRFKVLPQYQELFNVIYPVGSIYMSVNNVDPGQLFGGTWAEWGKGRVPVGVDSGQEPFKTVEKTGGKVDHVLSTAEMPAHAHGINHHNHEVQPHRHLVEPHSHGIPALTGVTLESGSHSHGGRSDKDAASGTAKNRFNNAGADLYTSFTTPAGEHTHRFETNPGNTGSAEMYTKAEKTDTGTTDLTTTNNTGSSSAHNNLQPYITCHMWKRTA